MSSSVAILQKENLARAIEEAKKRAKKRKFKQSVEMIVVLRDVDVKQPQNRINVAVPLPHPPPGKEAKVAVFASGDLALKAREAGADAVLGREDIERLGGDKKAAKKLAKAYDFFLAGTDLMPLIGRYLGRYLGPRGKMPQPVPPNAPIDAMIERFRRSVRVRVRNEPQIMVRIGTEDQPTEELVENANAVLKEILKKFQPTNIARIYFKLSMGPAVPVEKKGGKR